MTRAAVLALAAIVMAAGAAPKAWAQPPVSASPPASLGPFRPIAAAPPSASPRETLQIALGEALFADRRLSGDGGRACTSCHDVGASGASGRARDRSPQGQPLALNTPTVFNAAANFRFNWSGNARTLEEQARASLRNPLIMDADMTQVVARLRADRRMVRRFRDAFGRPPDEAGLLRALARYEASLVTPGARFDRYLMGDTAALSAKEQRGYRLFRLAGCAACHQGVNVGGNLFQRSGVYHPLAEFGSPTLRVPSLRNVAATAPYFHDGSARTLEDAVRAMGRAQLNRVLSPAQVDEIAAFLRTLSGQHRGRAVAAPRR